MKTRRAYDAAEDQRRVSDLPMFAPDYSDHASQKVEIVFRHFEERRPTNASLAYVRGKLVELYNWRVRTLSAERWHVNADDADNILKKWSDFPSGGNQSWRGSIFRNGWEKTGQYVKSERPHMNATDLPCWRPRA